MCLFCARCSNRFWMLTSVPLKETWNDKLDARLIGSLTGSSHLLLVKRNVRSPIICIGRNIGSDINRQFYNRSLVEALRDQYARWCPPELRLDASADEFWHPSLLFVLLGPWRNGEMNYHLLLNFLIDSRWILHGSTIWPGGFSCSVDLIHIQ